MPSLKLTKRAVEAIEPAAGVVVYWDTDLKGFGLKVTPAGKRVYIFQYRMGGRGSKLRRLTIGDHGRFTAEQARHAARKAQALKDDPVRPEDPGLMKRKRRDDEAKASHISFVAFVDRFITYKKNAGKRSKSAWKTKEYIDRDAVPKWRHRALKEIGPDDVHELIEEVSARSLHTAARLLSALRTLFAYAVEKRIIETNPCVGIKPPIQQTERDRALSPEEIADVWRASGQLNYPFGPFVRMLILTAQRRGEVAGMRWDEIDHRARTWIIPGSRTKNGESHTVHLSKPALDILDGIPRIGPCIFTTHEKGEVQISGFSKVKRQLDTLASLKEPWTFHDLRRTAVTRMANDLRVTAEVADKILNHSAIIKGVARVYNRAQYLEERRSALEAWGNYVLTQAGDAAQEGAPLFDPRPPLPIAPKGTKGREAP